MHFYLLVEVLLLLIVFLVGCAAAAAACAAYNISTEAERGTGYCFFLLRFCPLHCDAWDVYCCRCSWPLLLLFFRLRCFGYCCGLRCCWDGRHAGKINKGCNKILVHFYFLVQVLLLGAAAAAHITSTAAERGTGYCFFLLRFRYYYYYCFCWLCSVNHWAI